LKTACDEITKCLEGQAPVDTPQSHELVQELGIQGVVMDPNDELFKRLTSVAAHVVPQSPFAVKQIKKEDLQDLTPLHDGTTKIYSATYMSLLVAVKVLGAVSPDDQLKFQRLIRIATSVTCTNIVQVYGACLEPNFHAIVMEFMEYDLEKYLKTREFLWAEKARMGLDVALALSYLAENKILHRNLSSRVFLCDDRGGPLKLTDFTVAKGQSDGTTVQTKGTPAKGTVQWMAPELLEVPAKYSQKSEIYAFGVIFWEIATRKPPRAGMSDGEIFASLEEKGRDNIPEAVPAEFRELIEHCWAHEASERPSMPDILARLTELYASFGGKSPSVLRHSTLSASRRVVPLALSPSQPLDQPSSSQV